MYLQQLSVLANLVCECEWLDGVQITGTTDCGITIFSFPFVKVIFKMVYFEFKETVKKTFKNLIQLLSLLPLKYYTILIYFITLGSFLSSFHNTDRMLITGVSLSFSHNPKSSSVFSNRDKAVERKQA